MRSILGPVLFLATVACGSSAGPSASAEPPVSPPPAWDVSEPQTVAPGPRVELVGDDMRPLPVYVQAGRTYVLGEIGERYRLHIVNPTAGRVEAVVSVDGLDAIDGRPAHRGKRGYLVGPFDDVTVEGWRTSLDAVAAFRFSSVRASYAARTGPDRNVGVIGVAFFRERQVQPRREVIARPAPASASRSDSAPVPAAAAPKAPSGGSAADGSGAAAAPPNANEARPGLGTEFGEAHVSHVTEVPFTRASTRPDALFVVRYDDAPGLAARGIRVERERDWRGDENDRRDRAEAFPEARFAQPPR